ncbi:MAG: zinc-binding dehydrogenase [Clostridiales bacterium]|jgi:threonine dehydrogenase-like Zn-dependent dehydrogenase|nr:zinc-binding dehydrogenase [Clostridiales bacterium]
MKTKAVRLYGQNDLRLEEFELPQIRDDEILAHIITDSICMSSYKATIQGANHKRVPKNVAENPIIIGHEFCGEIVEVGKKWADSFKPGDKFSIQPALNHPDDPYSSPGYSFPYIGGAATYVIIPNVVMELGCLLPYSGEAFYLGSLSEPMSCIVGTYHAMYHTRAGEYIHDMGIKEGGKLALFAAAGPMGLGFIDYALHCDRKPSLIVVTDIDQARLDRAMGIYTVEEAARQGIKLIYVNTATVEDATAYMKELSGGGFDDIMCCAPVRQVVELADSVLAHDGCLNFFAGPSKTDFSAMINFYNVHYLSTHFVGTSGGSTNDMRESLEMMSNGTINPSSMITHIGGLGCVPETTKNLPSIPGGKKLIYTNIDMDLTAIDDFAEKGKTDPFFAGLAEICARHNNLWNAEAEKYLLANK